MEYNNPKNLYITLIPESSSSWFPRWVSVTVPWWYSSTAEYEDEDIAWYRDQSYNRAGIQVSILLLITVNVRRQSAGLLIKVNENKKWLIRTYTLDVLLLKLVNYPVRHPDTYKKRTSNGLKFV